MFKKLGTIAEVKTVKKFTDESNCLWIVNAGPIQVLLDPGINKPEMLIQITPGKEILKEYLYHLLKRPLKHHLKENTLNISRITIKDLKSFEILVLPIDKQQKVLKSKNVERRVQKLWLEARVRTLEKPFTTDLDFEGFLKLFASEKG